MPDEAADRRWRARIAEALAALDREDALGRDGRAPVTLDQQSVGRLSRMDALQQQAMARATQDRRDTQRRRLTAALDRIAEGQFGYCEECGEEIAGARLALDPAATRCISCARG